MNQPTDYEFSDAKPSDAETVRRFLAKAYGDDHPAMVALDRLAPPPAPHAPELGPAERLAIVSPAKPDFREVLLHVICTAASALERFIRRIKDRR